MLFFSLGLIALLSQSRRLTDRISEHFDFARMMGIASAVLIIALGSYTMFHSIRSIYF